MAGLPTSTLSSARKSVKKHGLGVMEYQMEGINSYIAVEPFVCNIAGNLTVPTIDHVCA